MFCNYQNRVRYVVKISGLAKVIFTTNVDAENQTLINQKCDCEVLNRMTQNPCFQLPLCLSEVLSRKACMNCFTDPERWLTISFAFFVYSV
jgi:hypothetical protein